MRKTEKQSISVFTEDLRNMDCSGGLPLTPTSLVSGTSFYGKTGKRGISVHFPKVRGSPTPEPPVHNINLTFQAEHRKEVFRQKPRDYRNRESYAQSIQGRIPKVLQRATGNRLHKKPRRTPTKFVKDLIAQYRTQLATQDPTTEPLLTRRLFPAKS